VVAWFVAKNRLIGLNWSYMVLCDYNLHVIPALHNTNGSEIECFLTRHTYWGSFHQFFTILFSQYFIVISTLTMLSERIGADQRISPQSHLY